MLKNSANSPLYLFCFAAGNARGSANRSKDRESSAKERGRSNGSGIWYRVEARIHLEPGNGLLQDQPRL